MTRVDVSSFIVLVVILTCHVTHSAVLRDKNLDEAKKELVNLLDEIIQYDETKSTSSNTNSEQWLKGRFGREVEQWLKGRFGDAASEQWLKGRFGKDSSAASSSDQSESVRREVEQWLKGRFGRDTQWLKGRFGRESSDQWLKGRFGRDSADEAELNQWLKGRFGRELADQWLKGRFGDVTKKDMMVKTQDNKKDEYNKEVTAKLESEVDQWLKGRFGREMDQWLKGRFGRELDQWLKGRFGDLKQNKDDKNVKDHKTEKDYKKSDNKKV